MVCHQVFQIGQNDQRRGKKTEQTSDPVHRKENGRKEEEGVPTEKMYFRQLLKSHNLIHHIRAPKGSDSHRILGFLTDVR